MFFILSKVLWWGVSPVTLLLLGALLGVLLAGRRPNFGRGLALACILALIVFAAAPVGALLLRPIEARFPPPPADIAPPYGIIVLGGAISEDLSAAHGQTIFGDGAARLTQAAILARRFPEARIVYTGGSASFKRKTSTEAAEAKKLLVALGVDPARIDIETRSRNTDENARFTAAMVGPRPDQTWLIVTSAWHIPRSMGLFRKAGFNVVAYPVDYHAFGDRRDFRLNHDPARGLWLFEMGVHEWIGLTAYRLAGKIEEWFPTP
jgi:uncharacterized SAM-binding protein YcdF (DUF218 family)